MVHSRIYFFVLNFVRLLLIYSVGLLLFLASRIYFILEYGNLAELSGHKSEVAAAFFVGFRTDTMSISYVLLPVFLLILGIYLVPASKLDRYLSAIQKFTLGYSTVVLGLFVLILIADFFFYRFFNDHLNVLVFALFEDDTKAVLTSVWTDYPVMKIGVIVVISLIAFIVVIRRILKVHLRPFHWGMMGSIVAVFVCLVLVFTGLRNSWGMFPFRMQNTVVSDNTFINKIGIGGVYALQDAFKEKSESTINTDSKATLKKYKFKTIQEAVEAYLNHPVNNEIDPLDALKTTTPTNDFLEKNKPHIVVIQMESMSNYLLDFHTESFNLLGELENSLKDAYVFRNFVPATPTTINSLEALLIASPETPVSQSIYQDRKLSTSSALPYLNAGYETSFITGAELAWRNLDGYLSNVHFQNIIGNAALKRDNSKAEDGEWGTYDEFMFDRVYKQLEQANQPQFVYAMTTSNHTPFDLPETYRSLPLQLPENISLKVDRNIAMKNFMTYQYANDCLGKFIKKVKESKFGSKTIIVAVGDHTIYQLFSLPDSQLLSRYSIPLIFIVPEGYKPLYEVDQTRFGSHKDVFPTLFNISLSRANYLKSGNNLMASPTDSTYFFGVYKYDTGFSKDGSVRIEDNLRFSWADQYSLLGPATNPQQTDLLHTKTRAYSAVMSCYIKRELLTTKPNP